jgi:hypothetical protein
VAAQIPMSFNRTAAGSVFHMLVCEAVMRSLYEALLGAALVVGLTSATPAQNAQPDQVAPISASPSLTGKERLGRKWMDEQRIDNCNVPPDKRGTRPRSSACAHIPTG